MKTKLPAHRALWWTSELKWDRNGILVPSQPVKSYNPFQFYFPPDVARQKTSDKSLPYRFLEVDSTNREAVFDFCKRFGLLGNAGQRVDKDDDSIDLDSLNSITPIEKRSSYWDTTIEGSLVRRLGASETNWRLVFEPMGLLNFREAQESMRIAIGWLQDLQKSPASQESKASRLLLQIRLNGKMAGISPRLDWDPQGAEWIHGWDIGSLEAVMYLMLYIDVLGGGLIRICPGCSLPFMSGRESTTYCSLRCRNRLKTRDRRKRVAEALDREVRRRKKVRAHKKK